MKIDVVRVGYLQTNCYIVSAQDARAVVIDPGDEAEKIAKYIDDNGITVEYIFITHGHFDHIGALAAIKEKTGAKVVINERDAEYIKFSPDILCKDSDEIKAAGLTFRVIQTPGHTKGGVCYLCENAIFSGDTLFYESVGRTDLPNGDFGELCVSLKRLSLLAGEYDIYPGHGQSTTLSHEKKHNPFFIR